MYIYIYIAEEKRKKKAPKRKDKKKTDTITGDTADAKEKHIIRNVIDYTVKYTLPLNESTSQSITHMVNKLVSGEKDEQQSGQSGDERKGSASASGRRTTPKMSKKQEVKTVEKKGMRVVFFDLMN